MLKRGIADYNGAQAETDKAICELLSREIAALLPEAEGKIWHRHPVWFLANNPIVGYSKLKDCVRLMLWSGASFGEAKLRPGTGKFKDASVRYTHADQVDAGDLARWLGKARLQQWDYGNLVKRKGRLVKIGDW